MKKITQPKRMKFKYFLLFIVFGFNGIMAIAQSEVPEVQKAIEPMFNAGVNISLLENYWSSADVVMQKENIKKLDKAYALGFKTVRIPIKFDMFLKEDKVTFNPDVLKKLGKVYGYLEAHDMTMILTYHFGVTRSKLSLDALQKEIKRGLDIWTQVINLFKGKGYNRIFFGLYDEPRMDENSRWELINKTAMAKLRPLDPDRYWIIGTNNYMNVTGFESLIPIPNDDKVLYAFHFYDPYIFTHQGAPWDKDKAYMKVLPYPFVEAEMPPMPERARNDKDMSYNYNHYSEVSTRQFIEDKIKIAHDWSVKNNVPVICTEAGTIATIPEKYRSNYIKDVSEVLRSYSIPMVIWDMEQSFKITNQNGVLIPGVKNWVNSYK